MKTAEEHGDEILEWVRRCQENGMNKVSPEGVARMTVTIIGEAQRESAEAMRQELVDYVGDQLQASATLVKGMLAVPLPGDAEVEVPSG